MAIFYYKKFLSDAPADAAQRQIATSRLEELEAAASAAPPAGDTTPPAGDGHAGDATPPAGDTHVGADAHATGADTAPPPDTTPHPHHARGTPFTAKDFEHQIIDEAPPYRPLDLTAYAPPEAGWKITLFYRKAGEAKFTPVPMRPHYHDLVGRIPGSQVTGESIQYYIEVRDRAGAVVTRAGKASSPNLVYLDPKARPRFYPDIPDDDDTGVEENPLPSGHGGGGGGGITGPGGAGFFDVGSTKFRYAKWGATGTAAGMFAFTTIFYMVSSSAASTLEGDAARSQTDCGSPPCSTYDADLKVTESRGKSFETMANVTLVVGIAATGVAGYYWYREYRERHRHHAAEHAARRRPPTFVATPVVGDGFLGGAAALRF